MSEVPGSEPPTPPRPELPQCYRRGEWDPLPDPRWGLGPLQVCQVMSGRLGVKWWQWYASRARLYFSKRSDLRSGFMAYIRN